MSILVIAEHDNNSLKGATLNTVTAATSLSGDVAILVAGSNIDSVVAECQTLDNVSKILTCDSETYVNAIAEDISSLVLANCDGYTHILAPATTFGKNLMPRISAKLDSQQISDIISVESDDTFKRPIYAGSCIATVKSNDKIKVVTVRPTSFDPVETSGGKEQVENISFDNDSGSVEFIDREESQSERPELSTARVVISGGRGLQSAENFKLLNEIADKLNAAVGASRAAVDAGYVSNDYQVGQTGKVVVPDLYIAVGISGAIQHLAGMKESKVIVAINKDEEAPIFNVADYGLNADLFEALPQLSSELDKLNTIQQ